MSLGGVMVFDPPAGGVAATVEAVRKHLAARLGELPRYTQRLSSARTGSLAWPHWVPDEHFDIRRHVGHDKLPRPGGDGQLSDWTAEFFSRPLDRRRPLWEMVLVEGLKSGHWALGWKTHHCLVDGVVAVELIGLLLGPEPTARTEPAPPRGAPRGPSWRSHLPEAAAQAVDATVRAGSAAVHAAAHPREALDRSRRVAELIVRDELRGAPHTSLNVPIGQTRRYAVVRAPLEELKAIGHHLGGSITDVVLAAATGGLRELLLSRGEELPPRGLRALVPVTRRDASDRLTLGNLLSFLFVDLPVGEPLAQARLGNIAAATRRRKSSDAAQATSAMIEARCARAAGGRACGAHTDGVLQADVQRGGHERAGLAGAAVCVRSVAARDPPGHAAARRPRGGNRRALLQRAGDVRDHRRRLLDARRRRGRTRNRGRPRRSCARWCPTRPRSRVRAADRPRWRDRSTTISRLRVDGFWSDRVTSQ